MPYIKPSEREKFQYVFRKFPIPTTKGELEYCIFWLMQQYKNSKSFTYTDLHDCAYAAQHCADEFRRRFLDKREDEARLRNGDVN